MLLVPNKFVFLNTPRTGSRAISAVFQGLGYCPAQFHHTNISEVHTDLPVFTMLRNPTTQLLSWWWDSRYIWCFEDYIKEHWTGITWNHEDLNPYAPIVDKFFIYEHGLEPMFEELGLPQWSIPRVGVSQTEYKYITPEAIDLINERFPKDVALYERETRK